MLLIKEKVLKNSLGMVDIPLSRNPVMGSYTNPNRKRSLSAMGEQKQPPGVLFLFSLCFYSFNLYVLFFFFLAFKPLY